MVLEVAKAEARDAKKEASATRYNTISDDDAAFVESMMSYDVMAHNLFILPMNLLLDS
jgi:hypothetical protein